MGGAILLQEDRKAQGAYLDYAAATPMDPEVLSAELPYLTELFENPSAPYARARAVRADYEAARGTLARLIGAKPDNVTMTAGATEANNLAFAAVDGKVLVDAIEHESVMACAEARDHAIVPVRADGLLDPAQLRASLSPDVELVSIELANGEIGAIQPIRACAQLVREERERRLREGQARPIWLHVDASQAAGYLSVNVASLGADLLTLSAAKIYGPKQVGLLWAADGVRLRPLVRGGGQENGVRSGTENGAGTVGFARALELAQSRRSSEAKRLQKLRDGMQRTLKREFPWAVVSGPRKSAHRLPNLLHISFPGVEARRLVILLEREGVSVGTGSACAASKMRVSRVLDAIGMPRWASEGSIRITLGHPTTEAEVEYATAAIVRAVRGELNRTGISEVELRERGAEAVFGGTNAATAVAHGEVEN